MSRNNNGNANYAVITIFFIVVAAASLHFCSRQSTAHDWYSGIDNPVTDEDCCGGTHCKPVDVGRIQETRDYFIVDGKWHFKKSEAMQSRDGQFHACIVDNKPRCFFYAGNV